MGRRVQQGRDASHRRGCSQERNKESPSTSWVHSGAISRSASSRELAWRGGESLAVRIWSHTRAVQYHGLFDIDTNTTPSSTHQRCCRAWWSVQIGRGSWRERGCTYV